ncbi:hypothetical protein OHA72_27125 [Dactylosporangium sp. NBC_01737]|uniref:hypothetical protein n=1 Tax=Dactylosporangium sp. NBC_01737 TaxID=2975959 RepID=UPI002E158678|nr:hypothetical protein OHA72_27125 [Dactylosporangium sp. NBC_01737]
MLLRLANPVMTNAVTLLRIPPMNDRYKDIEILALRHQPLLLHCQVGTRTSIPASRWMIPSIAIDRLGLRAGSGLRRR